MNCNRNDPAPQPTTHPTPRLAKLWPKRSAIPIHSWEQMQNQWRREEYFRGGMYEDEQRLLLFDRDREVDLRNAVQAPTWKQMRQLPGVTNEIVFEAKYPHGGRFGSLSNQRRMNLAFEQHGAPFLGCAAEAEAERRIVITALALERYRANHGVYPPALAALAPQFLKSAPVDFMDGRPLRYRLAADGHFLLYSVGLDCVDNGGKMPPPRDQANYFNPLQPNPPPPESDLVWPLPASSGQAVARREKGSKALQERLAQVQAREADEEAQRETERQARVKALLAMKPPFNKTDPVFRGETLSRFLQHKTIAKTKLLTLDQLLSLKQIGSGDLATFEVPVSYEAVTNIGELRLLVDGGGGGELQECNRATNGDCLLVWNTTYDPPGQHALQAQLHYGERRYSVEQLEVTGPVTPFYSTNVVQFFEGDSFFTDKGATLYAKLPEPHGIYTIELQTPEGKHLKTISGVTSNGVINVDWDLRDDQGIKYAGDSINAVFNVTLPDSGRSQTVKGP